MALAGIGPQLEACGTRLAYGLQAMLGHADHDLELVGARHAHHALALRHHLADLGLHGGDHAVGIRAQLGVGEVVLGRGELAPGLLDARLGRGGERLALLHRLRREHGGAAQVEIALMVGLGARVVGFGRGESGAGVVDGQAIVGGIELGDQVAGLDDGADIDGADDDLAGDAEAEIGLDSRHDGAGQDQRLAATLVGDFHHPGRTDHGFGGRGRP